MIQDDSPVKFFELDWVDHEVLPGLLLTFVEGEEHYDVSVGVSEILGRPGISYEQIAYYLRFQAKWDTIGKPHTRLDYVKALFEEVALEATKQGFVDLAVTLVNFEEHNLMYTPESVGACMYGRLPSGEPQCCKLPGSLFKR